MNIKQVYTKVLKACVGFSVYGTKKVEAETKELLPLLNEFYEQFLRENLFEIDKTDYEKLQLLFINIIRDLSQGLKNKDVVLLEDAMEYGLLPFLEIFMDEDEVSRLKEESVNE